MGCDYFVRPPLAAVCGSTPGNPRPVKAEEAVGCRPTAGGAGGGRSSTTDYKEALQASVGRVPVGYQEALQASWNQVPVGYQEALQA